MFRTRQEVDKHVNNSLKKINNETERNLRCFSFAKLYFNVGDYDSTVRYVSSYLSVKPKSPEGHNLLGKALEKLGKKQAALEAYKTSLQQDPKQNNLVIKVCELMAQDDVDVDNSGARYFCDLAQSLDPQNPIVSNLKERLITNEGKDPLEVTQFLLKELENRPTDVNLRVRLLKHFLGNNMIKEAYKHAFDIEQKKLGIFDNSIPWYETFAEVLVRYQRDASISTQLTWEFWFLSASVLEKLAALSLNENSENIKSTTDYITAVFNFDQSLLKASQSIDSCPDRTLLKEFLDHYEAQLCLHMSVLAFKQAKKDLMTFKEVQNAILPVLFIAYNLPIPDIQSVWFNNLPENRRLLVASWHKEASFRCSQAGNVLVGLAKDRRNILREKAQQYSTGMWREQLFKKIFVKRDQQLKSGTSFFISSTVEPAINLPEFGDLIKYNEVAQTVVPDSLHHYIWLALNYQNLSDFTLKSFDGLQYTVKNLSNCAAETLNVLDVQSFIYCAALCAQSKIKNADHSLTYFSQDRPPVLPVAITANLGTVNQAKFLQAAYRMYKHEYTSNMGEIRMILMRGIEVIRCVGTHGLDVKLLVTLASVYADKAKGLTKQSEIEANSARAELYWKTALPLLEKLKNEHALIYPNNRLFEYKSNKELTQDEISKSLESGKLFIGVQLMKKKEYEKAMHIFEGLRDPYASFYQSQIYKHMADSKTNDNRENVTSEMRSQNIILLSRARDCLYLTLDRLREPSQDRNHPLNAQLGTEIEKTERLLSRIDPDCTNRNECDGMSDENISDDSVGEHYLSTYTHHNSFHNGRDLSGKNDTVQMHSTPLRLGMTRQEARPSPERLDAQLRQLMASRDVAMNSVLEQNKMMVELQKSLTEEIRGFKEAVKSLTSAVDERAKMFTGNFEDVKKMVEELTSSVDDRLQNVTDMVQEMRKELNEIKREQNKNAQLSVEDLYDLGKDQDYNSTLDYNLGNNLGSAQSNLTSMVNNLYPNYRLPQAPGSNLAAAYGSQSLYAGLYPGLPYPYGPLGLPQPGTLPFLQAAATDQQQLAQLAGLPGLGPSPYQPANATINHLTSLSQGIATQTKESPKTVFSNANLVQQPGLDTASAVQAKQGLLQVKEPPKSVAFGTTAHGSFGQSSFLGQNFSASSPIVSSSSANVPSSKAPPVNVVITSSDPLPTFKATTTQPILSVTIPPQHIKGNIPKPVPVTMSQTAPLPIAQAHNYQIPLSTTSMLTTTPSILSQPPPIISTQSLLSNIPTPAISAIAKSQTPAKDVSLGIQIEKVLDQTFSSADKSNTSINKSNVSSTSLDEYDPRPDFQPIIPLPDEVLVTTGEEKETELFCQRAKLFRLALVNGAKEWKERGVGNIKILFNPETGKVRVIMRREQVHKICANHFLTKDTVLSPMANNDRAYIWAAHDYADEQIVLEKFCVKFKTAEEAKKFADAFSLAKTKISEKSVAGKVTEVKKDYVTGTPKSEGTTTPLAKSTPTTNWPGVTGTPKSEVPVQSTPSTNLGGFKFISTPTFIPKEEPKPAPKVEETVKEPAQPSPFAAFSFGAKAAATPPKNLFENLVADPPKFSPLVVSFQTNSKTVTPQKNEDEVEEFEPTAEFKPVVEKLPDLVEVKTGEENAEVVFEARSKLYRLETSGEKNEWKERGVGNIKILKEDTIRLVMRRDQVHKVCLNHQVLKSMSFNKNNNDPKAVVWHAQDFADGVLKPETFTARFKNEELANTFLKTLQSLQTTLDENSQVTGKHHKPEMTRKTGFPDIFKAAKGSWECKNCYVVNEGKLSQCVACETPKTGTSPKKNEPTFAFSVKNVSDSSKTEVTITPVSTGWGGQFKPAAGSWECKMCYVTNSADKAKCISCETPKESTPATDSSSSSGLKGISLDTGGLTFSFGIPPSVTSAQPTAKSDSTTPTTQKPEQPVQKFSFSVPPPMTKTDSNTVLSGFGDSFKPKAGTWECKSCYIRNEPSSLYCLSCDTPKDDTVPKKEPAAPKGVNLETPGLKFTFGMPAVTSAPTTFGFGDSSAAKTAFSWKPTETTVTESNTTKNAGKTEEKIIFGSPYKHDFEFTPRSPRRISTGQGDESDASYVEEEEANVYFKPVIPLPDIIEVKTGEENEQVLYSQRAKLYRFVGSEWKERGIGDVKILKDNSSGKLRVVMRRDQVLKICLNHWLTKDVEYLPKDEKTWLFHAADFSEGELSRDQFCLRFKNAEVAQTFKKTTEEILGGVEVKQTAIEDKKADKSEKEESDSDVEFVSETQVTAEEEKEAIRLGLPPKFLAYRQRPDCSCEQCKKDDEYLKELFCKEPSTTALSTRSSTNTSVFGTPTAGASTPSSTGSVFASPAATSFSFGTPTVQGSSMRPPKAESLRELIQKSPVIQQTTPKFGASLTLKTDTVTPTSASLVMAANTPKASEDKTPTTTQPTATTKESPKEQTTPSLFGAPLQKTTSGVGIFGQKSDNIFRTSASSNLFTNSSPSVFGGGASNIFNTPKEAASANTNIFGATPTSGAADTNSKSPFATNSNISAANPTSTPSTNLFQSSSATSFNSIFGSASSKSSNSSIFGSAASSTSNIFGNKSQTPSATNLFGTSSQGSIFGSSAKPPLGGNIFGQTIFGNKAEPKVTDANLTFGSTTTTNLKESDDPVLKTDSNLSFATLAAQVGSEAPPAFAASAKKESEPTPFAFLGAGAPVFGAQAGNKEDKSSPNKSQANKSQDAAGSDNEEVEGTEHDPHFEPIVPLPDQIVVSTGEEEETVLFNERAKLFRFDSNTKEWKERGVGQFKVLFHPMNKSYRLLLRREQVHKVVLNQRITPDLELQPMHTSDKAWIWAGMNYSDDETKLEQLAVKFKNSELAQAFKKCIEDTVAKVVEIQANKSQQSDGVPTTVQDFGLVDVAREEVLQNYEEEEEDDEDQDDDEDDEDERSIMFTKRCTLSEQTPSGWQQVCMGELQVYFDPELYTARVCVFNDNGETVSNTMIGVNTLMEIQGKECWWKAVEWANAQVLHWRTLKATFSSTAAAQEFHSNYLEGLNYAQEVGAIDELPNEVDHESDPLE